MAGKTYPRLVEILGLPVTMTGNFVRFYSIFNDVTGETLEIIRHIVLWYGNSCRVDCQLIAL